MPSDIMKRIVDGAMNITEKMIAPIESVMKVASGGDIRMAVPYRRRGNYAADPAIIGAGSVDDRKKKRTGRPLSLRQIKILGDTDPITWSIRKARRDQISQAQWTVVRDTEAIEVSLDQWHNAVKTNLNNWGLEGFGDGKPPADLDPKLVYEISDRVKQVVSSGIESTEQRAMLRWIFENAIDHIRTIADEEAKKVKIFNRPCRESPTWDSFIPRVLDDILMYDAGIMVKNTSMDDSNPIAEIYTRPGDQILLLRSEDGSVPEPPDKAYSWEKEGKEMAQFDDDELMYIMSNPQHDGYGYSSCEIAAYIITTTLFVDSYNMDFFKHSNTPPGIMDLGKNVTPDQRRTFAMLWNQEIRKQGGLHKMMFVSGSEGANYIPLRPFSSKDMQMLEYLKWTLSIKAACFQISPQDIGFTMDLHRTTSEVQYRITQDRGLKTMLELIQSHVNEEIIKRTYGYDNVKFKYIVDAPTDKTQEAQVDHQDIQGGVISINDRRKKLSLRPKEGGDIIWKETPQGMVPIEMADDIAEKMMVEGELTGQSESSEDTTGQQQQQGQNQQGQQNQQQGQMQQQGRPQREPQRMNVQTKGGVRDLKRVLSGVTDNLKKSGDNIQITIDHDGDDFGDMIQKYYGRQPEQIRFKPLSRDDEDTERIRRELGVSKDVLLNSITGGIAQNIGIPDYKMDSAIREISPGSSRKYMAAIPAALLVAAITAGGRGMVNRAAGIFRQSPRYGRRIGETVQTIRRHAR